MNPTTNPALDPGPHRHIGNQALGGGTMIPLLAATIPIHVTPSDWGAVLPDLILAAGVLLLLCSTSSYRARSGSDHDYCFAR